MKNPVRLLLAATTFAMAAASANASTVIIDFDNITAESGNGTVFDSGHPVLTDGFSFTTGHGHVITSPPTCDGGCASNGTQYLGGDMTDVVMTRTGGASFDVYSFDAAKAFYNLSRPSTILVEGTFAAGGTTSAYFTLANNDFSSISLTGFVGLKSLRFIGANESGQVSSQWIGVDNIKVSSVPEPAGYALMLTGFGAVVVMTSRRKQKHPAM